MSEHQRATPSGHGWIQIAVRVRMGDGRYREETRLISTLEWRLDKGGLRQEVFGMVDRSCEAAEGAERQVAFAAGPKGHLP